MSGFKIIIASTNKHKIAEITKILTAVETLPIEVGSLQDYNINMAESEEPHNSFMENAIYKAKYYAAFTKEVTLSEDSGLSIEALNGFPGVRTKDLIAECGGLSNAFLKLETLLSDASSYGNDYTSDYNSRAYFNSAIVLYIPKHDFIIKHEARDYGNICFPPRGNAGFAFDPIFIPEGYDKTFAELGLELKNKISHRAKAMEGLIEQLQEFLKGRAIRS